MSVERELLRECRLLLDDPINATRGYYLRKKVTEFLAQPEPLTPRQGLEEYKKGYAQAELDLKREPLSDDVFKLYEGAEYLRLLAYRKGIKILELTSKHEYAINLIRAVEKAHGIGGWNEFIQ